MFNHAQLSAHDIHGPISQLLKNLDGPDARRVWLPALKRMLRKENPWDGKPLYAPFKTVCIGEFRSVEEIERAYEAEGLEMHKWVRELIHRPDFRLATEVEEVDLVLVTPREVGVVTDTQNAPYQVILRAMRMAGLQPCTIEMMVQARRAFAEQQYKADNQAYLMSVMTAVEWGESMMALELCHSSMVTEDDRVAVYLGAFDVDGCLWDIDCSFICVQPRR